MCMNISVEPSGWDFDFHNGNTGRIHGLNIDSGFFKMDGNIVGEYTQVLENACEYFGFYKIGDFDVHIDTFHTQMYLYFFVCNIYYISKTEQNRKHTT